MLSPLKKKLKALFNSKQANADEERERLILHLVMCTAGVALRKNEFVLFAQLGGATTPIRLSGNSLPVFEYQVFDKKMMEFIAVRVELAKPTRMDFICSIRSSDPKLNGKAVDTRDAYERPFRLLAAHLQRYFPYPMDGGVKRGVETTTEAKAFIQSAVVGLPNV